MHDIDEILRNIARLAVFYFTFRRRVRVIGGKKLCATGKRRQRVVSMLGFRRFSVVLALAGYLLAMTTVHFLHDHSVADHDCAGCRTGHHGHGDAASDDDSGQHSGGQHSGDQCPSNNCEDSCFACRVLAVKSIAPTLVAVAEQVEFIRPTEEPTPVFTPAERPALPLSRAPPSV